MQIQYTDKISIKDGVKAVVYGPSGSGKTYSLSTAPRPFLFNAEKGLLSLRKFKIPYVTISTYKELVDAYSWAMKSAETKNFDTFGLDSLSDIAEVIAAEERRKNSDPRKWSPATGDSVYGIIRDLRDLKQKNVVCIAKQILVEQGVAPVTYKTATPLMPGEKLQNNLPYFWDLVLHQHTELWEGNTYYLLHCRASNGWHAKDRSGNLKDVEVANWGDIFNKAVL